MALNKYTTSRRFSTTTTIDRAQAVVPENPEYKLFREGKFDNKITESQAKNMISTKQYRVGKSGTIYDVKSGDIVGKGFQSFYTPPKHVPYSQMGSRVKGK